MTPTKKCTKCNRILPLDNFHKDKDNKDGFAHHCKDCRNKYHRAVSKEKRLRNPKKIWWLGLPIPNVIPGYKGCTRCLDIKPINQFSKNNATQDGFSHLCRACAKKYMDEYVIVKQLPPEEKTCHRCGETKPINEFVKGITNKDGYRNICKACKNKQSTIRGWGKKKIRRQYFGIGTLLSNTIPGYHSCTRCMDVKSDNQFPKATQKTTGISSWCLTCMSEIHLQIKEEGPEKIKEMWNKAGKQYRGTLKGKANMKRGNHIRKARIRGLKTEATLTANDIKIQLRLQNNKCAICGKPFNETNPPTTDHIVSVVDKGPLTPWNTQQVCGSCNSSKGKKSDKSKLPWFWTQAKKESTSSPAISECPQP